MDIQGGRSEGRWERAMADWCSFGRRDASLSMHNYNDFVLHFLLDGMAGGIPELGVVLIPITP